jgi:hypothetical protein
MRLLSARLDFALALFTPAGLDDYFRSMSSPAQSLNLPTGAATYSTSDLKEVAQRLSEYGARFLTPDEIADQMPLYPKSLPPNGSELLAASKVATPAGIEKR